LRTVVALFALPLLLLLHCLAAIALALFGASSSSVHACYVGFARACLRVAGTRLTVRGAERADPGAAYVVVTNHESAWDPVCLVAGLPDVLLRFVVKRPIMRIPVFGQALRLTGNVTVVRTQTEADVQRLREGMALRAPEISMLFFAEGTRSRDRRLHRFKMGAFATAISEGLPVLPVAVAGTFEIWPKGTLRLRRAPVAIEIGAPIPTAGLAFEDRTALRDTAHNAVEALRQRARKRLGLDDGLGSRRPASGAGRAVAERGSPPAPPPAAPPDSPESGR
jgi:1-acyl-sn-glycerol-3-phosphate acyltransferase